MDKFSYDDLNVLPIEDLKLADVPLLKIMYTEDFKLMIGRLNALIDINEHSERALKLTQVVIAKVPSNYTAWQFRFQIIKQISTQQDLVSELEWCSSTAKENEKNYQIWHYRELVIQLLIEKFLESDKSKYDLNSEFKIVELMLDIDEKNYHVWTHKRWVVRYFGLVGYSRELEYTEKMIHKDVRNNSAWSHRMFILGDSQFDKELQFVEGEIAKSPTNPSTWNYLRGLCSKYSQSLTSVESVVSKYIKGENQSVSALGVWVDILIVEKKVDEAKETLNLLIRELDKLRANFWRYKLESISTA